MGRALQDVLKERTGRGTVPNVLVGEVSLGGGDEMGELHEVGRVCGRLGEVLKGKGKGGLERCKKVVP